MVVVAHGSGACIQIVFTDCFKTTKDGQVLRVCGRKIGLYGDP